jgi:hypothetical protein
LAGYPTKIAGVKVDFYRYSENFNQNNARIAQAIKNIPSAALYSFGVYSTFTTLPDGPIAEAAKPRYWTFTIKGRR